MTTVTTDTAIATIKGIQPLIEKIAAVFQAVNGAVDPDESVPAFMALFHSFQPLVKWLDREIGVPGGSVVRGVKVASWKHGNGVDCCVIFSREEVKMFASNWSSPEIGEKAAHSYLEQQECDFTPIVNMIGDLLGQARQKLTDRAEKLRSRKEKLAQVTALLSDATSEAERLVKPEVPLPPTTAAA